MQGVSVHSARDTLTLTWNYSMCLFQPSGASIYRFTRADTVQLLYIFCLSFFGGGHPGSEFRHKIIKTIKTQNGLGLTHGVKEDI